MAGVFPLSRQQIFRGGKPAAGARLFLFDGGTTTPRVGYRDLALTTPHPNPIVADADGRLGMIYLADGYYRQRLTTATGTLIFDDDGIPVVTTSAGGAGTTVDPDSVFKTRDVKIRFDDQPLAGYVRLNGRTIGSASSGATERANADTQSLYEELWDFANISVSGGKGGSAAADFAANKALTLPDMAGRLIAGMDTMGNGAAGRLTTAVLGSDPSAPGATGGAQTVTIAASNLPVSSPWSVSATTNVTTDTAGSHSHTASEWASGNQSASHAHFLSISTRNLSNSAAGSDYAVYSPSGVGTQLTTGDQTANHFHGGIGGTTSIVAGHTHTASATTSVTVGTNSGGGQATNKLPPLMTLMIYIRL